MKYSVSLLALVALASLWRIPVPLHAQSTNDRIIALQRDISEVGRKIDTARTNESERLDALEALLKQAAEVTRALSMEMKSMQQNVEKTVQKSMAEQQSRVSDPLAAMKSGVDNVGQDVLGIRTDLTALSKQVARMEETLRDVKAAVNTLALPPPAPPPSVTAPTVSSAESAELLFTAAERDFQGGRNELAQKEFSEFWATYPNSPNAPRALLFLGQIYDRVKMYEDARQAFDTILERFPDSTTTPEAAFWKAEILAKQGSRSAALVEFDNFIKKYPDHLNAALAKARAAELRRSKGK